MVVSKYTALGFLCGMVFGVGFALMLVYYQSVHLGAFWWKISPAHQIGRQNAGEENTDGEESHILIGRASDHIKATTAVPTTKEPFYRDRVDNITAEQLYSKVRVLCWIMTSPATLRSKATHVKETWSKRCNIRLFMSSVEDKNFPAVGLPVKEGRDQLYEKTKEAYKYIWKHHQNDADWFMKADDDTFVIVENLRFLLKDYDPGKPFYFGHKFKVHVKQGYMSGGAGYVLSKEALKRFIDGIDSKKCPTGVGVEDVEMGKCMSLVGAEAGDSRDVQGKETFHHYGPVRYNSHPTCSDYNCSSNYPISFHYVDKDQMHMFDYMIYRVKLYGVSHIYKSPSETWPTTVYRDWPAYLRNEALWT